MTWFVPSWLAAQPLQLTVQLPWWPARDKVAIDNKGVPSGSSWAGHSLQHLRQHHLQQNPSGEHGASEHGLILRRASWLTDASRDDAPPSRRTLHPSSLAVQSSWPRSIAREAAANIDLPPMVATRHTPRTEQESPQSRSAMPRPHTLQATDGMNTRTSRGVPDSTSALPMVMRKALIKEETAPVNHPEASANQLVDLLYAQGLTQQGTVRATLRTLTAETAQPLSAPAHADQASATSNRSMQEPSPRQGPVLTAADMNNVVDQVARVLRQRERLERERKGSR